jgi:GntR family transcriptional regulator
MNFTENKAIYQQIAELIYEKILSGEWSANERIPAVRDLSISLEVNPNTVMRTYQLLESNNIINLKRGTGYYLSDNAYNSVFDSKKGDFLNNQLPEIFKTISLLKISPNDIKILYEGYLSSNK